jgi:hypothetical protein
MWGQVTDDTAAKMMAAEDVARVIVDAMSVSPQAAVDEVVIRPVGGDL